METSGIVRKYKTKIIIFFAVIFLIFGATAASTLAATKTKSYSYVRFFYYRDGLLARESLFTYPSSIDVLAPQAYSFDGSGKLLGSINTNVLAFANKKKIKVMPLVTNGNFSKAVYQAILDDPAKQDLAINSLIEEAKKKGHWGWQLDFEQMDASYRDKYSAFANRVGEALRKNQLVFSVAVIAQVSSNPNDYPNDLWQKTIGVYDYAALAAAADFISLMSYDDPESEGPVVEYSWLKRVLDYSMKLIQPEKLSLGIPLYYWQWNNETGARIGIGGRQGIYNVFNKHKVLIYYSADLEAAYLTYWNKAKQYTIWYENAQSVAKKIELIKQYHLHGFSAWALGLELPSIFNVVRNNKY
jgi:spore germination protein YaaH